MDEFLRNTILGLSTASIFALAASGLVLTYTTTGIFNFAHGAIGMLGAFAFWQLHADWGWPAPIALAIVLLVLAPAFGLIIERGIMRGLHDAPETVRIVVTISFVLFENCLTKAAVLSVPSMLPSEKLLNSFVV